MVWGLVQPPRTLELLSRLLQRADSSPLLLKLFVLIARGDLRNPPFPCAPVVRGREEPRGWASACCGHLGYSPGRFECWKFEGVASGVPRFLSSRLARLRGPVPAMETQGGQSQP